jgi:UDP-glucose 4-epimerase
MLSRGISVTVVARPASDLWRISGLKGLEIVTSPDGPGTVASLAPDVLLTLNWAGVSAADRANVVLQQSNVRLHTDLIDAALAAGVRRIVGAGSQAEYGVVEGRILDGRALSPVSEYGKAKAKVAAYLETAARAGDIEWVWGRIFSVFGPMEEGASLLLKIARSVRDAKTTELSSGRQPWNYLYAADAASALAELVSNPEAYGHYNVGHPLSPPLRNSIEFFAREIGARELISFGPEQGQSLVADTKRLQRLGWEPAWDREEGLATTAAWLTGERVIDPFDRSIELPTVRSFG